MKLDLRPYQTGAVDELAAGLRAGHTRQVLALPTGAGKTVVATHLLQRALEKRTRAVFLVDRIVLAAQVSATFDTYGVPHGILQANNPRWRRYEQIQVATAQTLARRGFPDIGLLVVDEAHVIHKHTQEWIEANPAVPVVGLTATPFTAGLGLTFTNVVSPITTNRLIDQGSLVPLKIYIGTPIDMNGAKVVAGEWSDREVEKRGCRIVGDVVAEWQAKTTHHFGGPVKTLVFSSTIRHGEEIVRQFKAAGFRFEQISYRDGDEHCRDIVAEFRKPDSEIMGLVSCEKLVKGFDVPDVLCGVCARPYRSSFMSHVQQIGRVMRPAPGKAFALWLDHANNVLRFRERQEDLFEHGPGRLSMDRKGVEPPPPDVKGEPPPDVKCRCGYLLHPSHKVCPECNTPVVKRSLVEIHPGRMEELADAPTQKNLAAMLANKDAVWHQLCTLAVERKPADMEAARRFALAQYRAIVNQWPREPFRPDFNETPDPILRSRVRHNIIKYAKRRQVAVAAGSP